MNAPFVHEMKRSNAKVGLQGPVLRNSAGLLKAFVTGRQAGFGERRQLR